MTPESSALMNASWMRNMREARRSAMVKQMLIFADLVDRRALAGSRQISVRRRPTVESASRTYVR